MSWIRSGLCDIAIAGGADELNCVPFCGFASLGLVSDSLCAPFDRDRKGLNLGEGAGVLVLEAESSACQRGKDADLFLEGYGSASDAYHLTAPHPDGVGLEAALYKALSEADISSEDVCFLNAHGTATLDNDRVEAKVLNRVFGKELVFLSTKGFTGHTLGAAGGLEAAFTSAALREKWIPGSAGFVNNDSELPVAPVRKKTMINGKYAVSTSLAFGGNNSALVISRGERHAH
jgi:3-oxoacyl-(acyl-carrier-protein) synthase